jgi:L-ascorbate metabolism protein UlaG (beta-lactamase superfamily)
VGQSVVLKWLGNAGWEIQIGPTIILLDPFLTRGEASSGVEWKTDEEAVLGAIKRADYIFAGHSHADHIADVPFIAKKFGSKVIGSPTTTNIALTGGVDKAQLVTISGGEKLDFKEFSVQVIESEHGAARWANSTAEVRGNHQAMVRANPGECVCRRGKLSLSICLRQPSPLASEYWRFYRGQAARTEG